MNNTGFCSLPYTGRPRPPQSLRQHRQLLRETRLLQGVSGRQAWESEDYSSLFKLSEDTARIADGTPIIDLHLTLQAIRNVEDFDTLRKRLEEYAAKLRPFTIRLKNIVRMNVNNQPGRLWLLAERSPALEKMYNGLGDIVRELGYESYPYKSQNWLPHVKIVNLPENRSTQIKDPTFGAIQGITFTVRRLEWTVQRSTERWELLGQFSFSG